MTATLPYHILHEIRHIHITDCIQSGIDLAMVQHWAGRANPQKTLSITRTTPRRMGGHNSPSAPNGPLSRPTMKR